MPDRESEGGLQFAPSTQAFRTLTTQPGVTSTVGLRPGRDGGETQGNRGKSGPRVGGGGMGGRMEGREQRGMEDGVGGTEENGGQRMSGDRK